LGENYGKKIGAWKFDANHSALVLDNMSLMAHKVNKKYDEIISTFLSRPLLLSWIKANSNETMTKLYSEYHVDQLTSDDSTSFHYTGKSFSEALIFASTNPQYDDRLFIDLPVQYMKTTSLEHVVHINFFLF
jgi:hypothetical protein